MKFKHRVATARLRVLAFMILCHMILATWTSRACIADEPKIIKHQITGLFSPDREKDLQKVFATLPEIKLEKIDYAKAEAEFVYDPEKVFPNAKPEQLVEQFDSILRNASRHTFGVRPLCTTPDDELTCVEIPVLGLDCKACCLAAYESVYQIEGVERATASFKDGLVTAWIHPDKTNVMALEEALKKKGVTLPERSSGSPPE